VGPAPTQGRVPSSKHLLQQLRLQLQARSRSTFLELWRWSEGGGVGRWLVGGGKILGQRRGGKKKSMSVGRMGFFVHPQNGFNGLILNWCIGGC